MAVAYYVDGSPAEVEIVLPFPVSDDCLDSLHAACYYSFLPRPASAQPAAGILAARAHGIGRRYTVAVDRESTQDRRGSPAQLVLTVDYSRAALMAMLVVEEDGDFEYRRVLHDTNLGAKSLARMSDPQNGHLAQAFRNLVKVAPGEREGRGLETDRRFGLVG